jgi:signal transduction histidine kinase/ActR/RegA family two-component response regulator
MESWKPLHDYDSFIQSLDRREELALFETQLLKKNGDRLPVLISTRFFQLDEENCLLMIVRDATQSRREENERLELQSQLLQIQKMDSIGQLAGGVAHDVNNMVGAIQGFAELIRDKSDKQDRRYYYANQIVVSANRAADLTSNLLAFSRNTKIEAVSVNMVDIIENTQALFVQAIFPLIIVKFSHHKDHYIIEGDTGHLEAAVMNLLINARDAMPDGGTLMLKLEQIYLTQTQSQKIDPELAQGNYVRLIVRDTGCGIAEEIQDKVILPFFTTKEAGQGTGLGLSSVYGTVKSHQGAMTIESSSGQGTIMSLYFPSSEEIHATEDEIDTPFISGEGVVLIVDDEEQMRLMAQETLEHAGYKTLLATNGAEAVRLYARHRDIIDLVVLDLVMPIMNGTDTLQALRTFDSKAKVLIMTGYTSEQHRELIAQGAMAIMMKPFKQSLLCQQVDAAIKTIRLSERKHRPERLQW